MMAAMKVFDRIQTLRVCHLENDVKSYHAVNTSPYDMLPGIVLLEYRVGRVLQQSQHNSLHTVYVYPQCVLVRNQSAVKGYQRSPVIKYDATSKP
ncbi:hypothetical protein TNCV_1151711 [Trichonephila clavipes]|nr:hypothetical protein TNCV_1151711 [Trichonephila clavipes]